MGTLFEASIHSFPLEHKAILPKGVGRDIARGEPPKSLRTAGAWPTGTASRYFWISVR